MTLRGTRWVRPLVLAMLVAGAFTVPAAAQGAGGDDAAGRDRQSVETGTETNGTAEREAREAGELPSEEGVAWLPLAYYAFVILGGVLLFFFWTKVGRPGNPWRR